MDEKALLLKLNSEKIERLENQLKAEKLINLMTKEETIIPLRMWVKSLQARVKELEEGIEKYLKKVEHSDGGYWECDLELKKLIEKGETE